MPIRGSKIFPCLSVSAFDHVLVTRSPAIKIMRRPRSERMLGLVLAWPAAVGAGHPADGMGSGIERPPVSGGDKSGAGKNPGGRGLDPFLRS